MPIDRLFMWQRRAARAGQVRVRKGWPSSQRITRTFEAAGLPPGHNASMHTGNSSPLRKRMVGSLQCNELGCISRPAGEALLGCARRTGVGPFTGYRSAIEASVLGCRLRADWSPAARVTCFVWHRAILVWLAMRQLACLPRAYGSSEALLCARLGRQATRCLAEDPSAPGVGGSPGVCLESRPAKMASCTARTAR